MKTFSRLSLLTLLFLGIALMLVGRTTDVYAQQDLGYRSLETQDKQDKCL